MQPETAEPEQIAIDFGEPPLAPSASIGVNTNHADSGICPDCGAHLWLDGGCRYCRACGHSECPLGDMPD
jgi:hypothetical protein